MIKASFFGLNSLRLYGHGQQTVAALTVGDFVEHVFRDGLGEGCLHFDWLAQQGFAHIQLFNLESTGLCALNLTLSLDEDAVLLAALGSLL